MKEEDNECLVAMNLHYQNSLHYPDKQMFEASHHNWPTDMGSPVLCEKIGHGANYVVSQWNLTVVPFAFRTGLCLPKRCT